MAANEYAAGKTVNTFTHRYGYSPNTLSVTSTRCRVMAVNSRGEYQQIGVMSTFDPSESRSIEPVRAVGFGDKIMELVPGATEPMTISVTRTAQYLQNIYQAFGYKGGTDGLVRSLREHRWPFNIDQEIVLSEGLQQTGTRDWLADDAGETSWTDFDEHNRTNSWELGTAGEGLRALFTQYVGCWFSSWSTSFAADSALVQENCEIQVTDVYDKSADEAMTLDEQVSGAVAQIYRPDGDSLMETWNMAGHEGGGVSNIGYYGKSVQIDENGNPTT